MRKKSAQSSIFLTLNLVNSDVVQSRIHPASLSARYPSYISRNNRISSVIGCKSERPNDETNCIPLADDLWFGMVYEGVLGIAATYILYI